MNKKHLSSMLGFVCCLSVPVSHATELHPISALNQSEYVYDYADQPTPQISAGPFYTIQENIAVGSQLVSLTLEDRSEISLMIDEKTVNPGDSIQVEVEADENGIMKIPFKSLVDGASGKVWFEFHIAELYSELDVVPTISIADVVVPEGNIGSSFVNVEVSLDVKTGHEVTVDYITSDNDAYSIAGEATNLAYDAYGNPFISVVDNAAGGRLVLDGGFPKFYNNTYSKSGDQWRYLNNAIQWIKRSGGGNKILLFGGNPSNSGKSYRVKGTGSGHFYNSFNQWARDYGYSLTVKDSLDFGGVGNVNVPLDYLNQYDAVIYMGSNYSNVKIFNKEGVANFGDYSKLGGGIMIITDHDAFQAGANQVASNFNIRFYGNVNRSNVSVSYLKSKYGDHELWNGLTIVPAGGSEGNVDISAVDVSEIDYEGQGGVISFPEGETKKTLKVRIYGDTVRENDETFSIELSNPVNAYLSDKTSGNFTILNDD